MMDPDRPSVELLRRCHRSYIECLWQNIRSTSGALRREVPEGVMMRCDLPSSVANVLFLIDPVPRPEDRVRQALSFFGPKLPWRLLSTAPGSEELGRTAVRLGLRPASVEPGLLLSDLRRGSSPPSPLTIRAVEDAPALADFGRAWCDAFRIPQWVFPVAMPRVPPDDLEHGAQNRFFVGYEAGRPVACATVTVTERVAGIASVGTVPAARGRGYGTAITGTAVESGRSLGAEVAYLGATTMGYPVYERMGFRRVAEYPGWQVPVGAWRMLGVLRTLRRLARSQAST